MARILLINLLRSDHAAGTDCEHCCNMSTAAWTTGATILSRRISPVQHAVRCLCRKLEQRPTLDHEAVITLIGAQLEGYEGPVPDAKSRLTEALELMLLNIAAAMLMQQADILYRQLFG